MVVIQHAEEDQIVTDSFEAFFRLEFSRLVAIGVGLTGDVELARDLAQETMARASADWERVSAADSPAAWTRRVLRNLVIDKARRRDTERRSLRLVASADRVVPSEPARFELADFVATLSERQRATVVLFYVDDLPVDTIATTLGISSGTVKSQLARARRRLSTYLAEKGELQ